MPFGVELPYDSTELLTINRAEYWSIFDEYRTGLALAGQNNSNTFNYELAAFIRPQDNPNGEEPEEDYVGRVQLNTLTGVILGSSVYYDRSKDGTNNLNLTQTRFGVDARIDRSALALWFEFMTGTDDNRPTNGSAKTQTDYIGYYGMMGYTFKPDWQIVAKYDVYDPNTHQGNDSFRRYTAGINWQVDELIRLQANLEYSHSEPAVDPDVTSIVQFQLVY